STWQAYQITPIEYEFWQGDASRLHKRLRYDKQRSVLTCHECLLAMYSGFGM
ncbi:MAG: pyridoxine 5'-phosphate oxidase C-terminal domain-containing protein, partial [Waterburya sp.]